MHQVRCGNIQTDGDHLHPGMDFIPGDNSRNLVHSVLKINSHVHDLVHMH